MYNLYKNVQGFPDCEQAKNKKVRWQEGDDKEGIDVKAWQQVVDRDISESDCTSKGGIARTAFNGDKLCFTYNILTAICLTVAFR